VHKAFNVLKYNLLVLLLGTLLSLFIAYKLSQRIVGPINNLQHFAGQVCDGNLDVRTSISGRDELAATGTALNEMASRIRQLETSRRLFIQTSAHELRNPLAGIRGIVSLVRNRIASGKAVDDNMLALAEKEVDRLATIINQLLETFKEQQLHLDGLSYKWETVNLKALLVEITTALQTFTEKHYIVLELGDNQQVLVKGDASRLEDVLRNLISNAIKYTPGEGRIIVSLQMGHGKAVIGVKDEGIGIPDEHLQNIFESFFRCENYAGKDPGGMGLGLYISNEIILKHGGRIWAENNPDQGSTVYVELPLYDGEE
jgi:signal transduction histidine kinase